MESPLKNNPDQQAASVQLPWLKELQRDREALAAETDQAPPQEPAGDGVKWPYNDPRFVGYFSGVPVNGRGHRIHPPTAPAAAEQELLPCPFCGQMPNVEECEEGQGVYVWCETKECPMHGLSPSRDKWNRRPAAPVAEQEPQLFRKKPVVIEAIKWTGWNAEEMRAFGVPPTTAQYQQRGRMLIPTLEGEMTAQVGDWIIKGVKGEFYPCKPDIFVSTYEPAAPVAVGETPETDALLENLRTLIADRGRPCGPADLERVGNHARNLERQRDAALKASNEHFQSSLEMAKQVSDLQLANKELLQKLNVATGSLPLSQAAHEITDYRSELEKELDTARRERDEARKQNTLFEEEMDAIRTVRDIARERCKKQEEQLTALAAERDRLREELAMAKADASNYKGANISKAAEISQIRAALATAQADIAKLCSVIAAAFAETAKPLNASVEYDARPTEWERLKKVQEILASALDAAEHGARDYQAAEAEAAEIERRYKWLLENIHRAQFGTGAGYDMEKGRVSLILNWIEFVKARPWDSRTNAPERIDAAVRAAIDAASATEAKRIPVKVRMAKDLGPDLWAIMAPNTPRFWVKKGDEVPVKCNQHGAMTLLTPHGELGVKPQECEIIEWQYGGQP